MKFLLCYILLCKISSCFSNEAYYSERKYDGYRNVDLDKKEESIWRPCPRDDVKCIRAFFSHNSGCKLVYGPAPDPYKLKTLAVNIPQANLTFEMNNYLLKGLNKYKIEEFYIDKRNDTLVFEVQFENIVVFSDRTRYRYFRKGEEPIVIEDFSIISYRDLSFTLTIRFINKKGIHPKRSHVFTFVNDDKPWFYLSPKLTENKEPQVIRSNAILLGALPVTLKEAFVYKGPVFFNAYFKSIICNYKDYDVKEYV